MLIAMSERDIQRFKVLNDLRDHRLSQMDASALAHAARGRPSNRCYSSQFKATDPRDHSRSLQ